MLDIGVRWAHNCDVAKVHRLSNREHFVDDRGTGLRATWHPEGRVVVVSLWDGDRCRGTFRLPIADAARLANLLLTGVTEWASMIDAGPEEPEAVNSD